MGVKMKVDKAIKATFYTNLIILNGFLVALLVGTILLMLNVSSASGNGSDFFSYHSQIYYCGADLGTVGAAAGDAA